MSDVTDVEKIVVPDGKPVIVEYVASPLIVEL